MVTLGATNPTESGFYDYSARGGESPKIYREPETVGDSSCNSIWWPGLSARCERAAVRATHIILAVPFFSELHSQSWQIA